MRHRLLRSISLAVVFGLLVALLPSGAHADALDDLEAQIQRYETQLAQINAQQTSVRDQIAVTQDKIARLQAVLVQLNSQLLENNARLSQNQAQLDELDRARTEQAKAVATVEQARLVLQQEYGIQSTATFQLQALQARLGLQQAQLTSQANGVEAQIVSDEQQVQSLLAFSHGAGGDIVAPEFLSDGWGKYYNQRDARWGNVYLGRSPYQVWEIGCLLSSVAMVYSHFGFPNVTPGVIAANPANFTSGGLLYNSALNVPGHPAAINNNPTRAWINQYLQAGGTVIVGMYIRTGGTHFVVLVAQNGPSDYWISDPWEENAMHVSYLGSP